MTNAKLRIAATLTMALLPLGLSGSAVAAWETRAEWTRATGELRLVQADGRSQPGSALHTAPEFPPFGYLEEYEDGAQSRFDRPGQALPREGVPAGIGSRSRDFAPEYLEFAPEDLGSRMPPTRLPGPAEPRGSAAGSRPMWAEPPFSPPSATQDRRAPASDPRGAWGEFPHVAPGMSPGARVENPGIAAEPPHPARGGYPAENPRGAGSAARPGSGAAQQWPLAPPGPGSSYLTHPEYQPGGWERSPPESPRDLFPGYRDQPGGPYGWGR